MRFSLILTLFAVSASCAHTSIEPRLDLVLPYDRKLEERKFSFDPYAATFEKDGKRLIFIAANHVPTKMKKPLTHPTMRLVRSQFERFDIDSVIVEGIQPWEGNLPSDRLQAHAKKCAEQGFRGKCGENFYTLHLALDKRETDLHVWLNSGEPTESEIAARVEEAGYSRKGLVAFYMVRQIPQWKRRGTLDRSNYKAQIEEFLKRYAARVGLKEVFGYEDFAAWYGKNLGSPKNYLDVTPRDSAPHGGSDGNFANKISHVVGLVRDREIVRKIAETLNHKNNVLVVYGGSHLIVQEPALIQMMGKPNYSLTD